MPRYDYIIAGAGAAGLSLVTRMIASRKFDDKRILLIDRAPKTMNDRTWCFWEKEKGFFEETVFKKWDNLLFHSNAFSIPLDIVPYQYKMIRGIDFYNYCFEKIKRQKNIDVRYGEFRTEPGTGGNSKLLLEGEALSTDHAIVFNSIQRNGISNRNTVDMLQHFKGWMIETAEAVFDMSTATLMDFRVQQEQGTTFVYVMPITANRALVEYTLFSKSLLEKEQYEFALRNYLLQYLGITEYRIVEEEFGVIPMTNAKFPFYQNGIYNIGTAGGQTKASTGYTFPFIQKQTKQIVDCLAGNQPLQELPASPMRFNFYDSVLLQLLSERKLEGREIFSRLFNRNKASAIFKFLDNETTIGEEWRLIRSLQISPFFEAAIKQLT